MSEITTLVGLLMGVVSFIAGAIAWYRGAVEKRYAAERSFDHLRRNQEQMGQAITSVLDEVESLARDAESSAALINEVRREVIELNRTFVEVKALTLAITNRMEGLAARFDSSTGGWMRGNQG